MHLSRTWLLTLCGLVAAEVYQPLKVDEVLLAGSPGRRQRAKDLDATGVACNNSPLLCSRSYSNITHLGAHDSAFVSNATNAYTISGNQFFDSPTQLDAGVRLLTTQIHTIPGQGIELHLCHTDCSLYDGGTMLNWLSSIKTWMDANPNDVVTLLFVNGENISGQRLAATFKATGIDKYAYTPPSKGPFGEWPTLGAMIKANTRLVVYIASLADNTAAPFMLDEFSYVYENPYEVTSFGNFTPMPDRPTALKNQPQAAVSSGRLFLLNHFLGKVQILNIIAPDAANAPRTNSPDPSVEGSLGDGMRKAVDLYGKPPTYVLVDWFNTGPAIATVDGYNGVTKPAGRKDVPPDVFSPSNPAPGSSSSSAPSASLPSGSSTPTARGGVEKSAGGTKMAILLAVLFILWSF